MVRKPDIQYIGQFYVYGSEVPAAQPKRTQKRARTVLPKAKPERKICIAVDPIALAGIVVSVVLLVLMVVGGCRYMAVCGEYKQMSDYVIGLQNENVELREEFLDTCDLADIEQKALGIGMIPASEAKTVPITVTVPEETKEPTLWENMIWFLKGLFA